MRTDAQYRLDRFAIAALASLPEDYLLPDQAFRDEIRLRAHPRPLVSDVDNTVNYLESAKRIHGTNTELGVKWSLTDAGRAWWEKNQ